MKQEIIEHELLGEVLGLMEKSGLNELAPLPMTIDNGGSHAMESMLITIRNLNARYDRDEALLHIKSLMYCYNIQIDEISGSGVR